MYLVQFKTIKSRHGATVPGEPKHAICDNRVHGPRKSVQCTSLSAEATFEVISITARFERINGKSLHAGRNQSVASHLVLAITVVTFSKIRNAYNIVDNIVQTVTSTIKVGMRFGGFKRCAPSVHFILIPGTKVYFA